MCKVDGKVYQVNDGFTSGLEGCAKCACTDVGFKCDVTQCQKMVKNQLTSAVKYAVSGYNDYTNMKDQIARQYFNEYEPQRLRAIKSALSCNSNDCPQLIAATDIKYNILDSVGRHYVGRGDKINKFIFYSTDTEVENNSPSQQVVTRRPFSLTMESSFEVIFTKTRQTYSEKKSNWLVYKKKGSVTFTQEEEERYSETNETTIYFPSQKITVAPFTKVNTTFNFFQYDDINNYLLDFEIADSSTLTHPELNEISLVVNVTRPLGDFLKKHIDFLSNLKYENDTVLKLIANEGKFILKNLPTIEKLTNYGFDVVFGRTESLK